MQIGQEGPMVHIGAAIASELTWMHGQFPKTKYVLPAAQTWWKKLTSRAWVFVSQDLTPVNCSTKKINLHHRL